MKRSTDTMILELDASGILYISPPEGRQSPETIKDAIENVQAIQEIGMDNITGILGHLPSHYVPAEVTNHYRQHAPNVPIALVGDSFFKKMMGNFFLRLAAPGRPVKIFSDREEALKWISSVQLQVKV